MGFHFFGLSVKNCPLLWFHCLQGNEGEGQRERGKSSTVWHITKGKRSFPCLSFGCRINWVWKAIEEKKRRGGKKIKRFFSHSPWALGLSFSVPQTTAKIVSPWSLCSEPQCSLEVLVCIVFGLVETRKKKKKRQTLFTDSSNSSVLLFCACWYLFFKCYSCSLWRFDSYVQWKEKVGVRLLHFQISLELEDDIFFS